MLLRQERFSGSVYLAGRAVEGMLRAVIWKRDSQFSSGKRSLDTGHDLREMLNLVESLGILRNHPHRDTLRDDVQRIARLWSNNMRFWPVAKVKTAWYDLGEIGGKRTLKLAAQEFCDSCWAVVRQCEELCGH